MDDLFFNFQHETKTTRIHFGITIDLLSSLLSKTNQSRAATAPTTASFCAPLAPGIRRDFDNTSDPKRDPSQVQPLSFDSVESRQFDNLPLTSSLRSVAASNYPDRLRIDNENFTGRKNVINCRWWVNYDSQWYRVLADLSFRYRKCLGLDGNVFL